MKGIHKITSLGINPVIYLLTTGLFASGMLLPAIAQVTSDGTTNTTVTQSVNNYTILNGIEKGSNLFHSFSNFSVPTGGSATFDLVNIPNITTIFSRVTGGNISNIDGLIRTVNSNNPVSLFLINPAGIVFGQNARLDIGGSFIGTTANSIKFVDEVEFSATNITAQPLLTMNVPIGLQMGQNSAPIQVAGTGHNLAIIPTPIDAFPPFTRAINPGALTVQTQRTLALVGGGISLDGAHLVAQQGQIDLGSVGTGLVKLSSNSSGYALDYSSVSDLQDIQLSHKSALDASGSTSSGGISLTGNNIRLTDGSVGIVQNLASSGSLQGSSINVRASGLLEFAGTTTDGKVRSQLITETTNSGMSGEIRVATKDLIFREGGQIVTRTFGVGGSGNVKINASESLQAIGSAPLNRRFLSGIFVSVNGGSSGNAGDLNISTTKFTASGGAIISTASFSTGMGGDLTLNADSVDIQGVDPVFKGASDLRVGSFSGGNGGNLTINARTVTVREGGRLNGTTVGKGSAGTMVINASESVDVNGGLISSSATSAESRTLLNGFTSDPTGNAGSISIFTDRLTVRSQGKVTVQNNGPTNGGRLRIDAGSVFLNNEGLLSASTKLGEGGDISLQARDVLLLRHGTKISAQAEGTGNGGNIRLNAPVILGLENSDIIASAIKGRGGNIQITTQGIFGLEYRDRLTPENDITASSEFGINGTVDINNFGIDLTSSLVELPINLVDSSQQIATGCSNNTGSSFVATGRGGVPQNPNQQVWSDRTWSDVRDISAFRKTQALQVQIPPSSETLVQATSWHRNSQGKIELIADKSSVNIQPALTCTAVPKI
ncbi:MAG: S-layer family protein [Nostoc sp.]|uniref:S-layer family protein n=1 Tax=Nostoc sp. TaxID=1180 RepID=UPI002FF50610